MGLAGAVVRRVVPASTVLRWLCRLDNAVYRATSRAAVWYGGGLHVKHRLTAYHDFFLARVASGERVLDIGCGHGALAGDLAGLGAVVTGVDRDQAAIREARSRYARTGARFVAADASRLPPGPFDVVILSNVLEHLDDRVAFLKAVVASSGAARVLVRVPLFERDWRVPLKRELGVDFRLDPAHRVEHTLQDFDTEIADAGLLVEDRQVRWGEIWAVCRPRR